MDWICYETIRKGTVNGEIFYNKPAIEKNLFWDVDKWKNIQMKKNALIR